MRTILAVIALTISTLSLAPHADAATGKRENLPTIRMKACPSEDQGTRCVWDAKHMGNGGGHSFWIDSRYEGIHYVSHAYAHRLLTGK